MSKILLMMSVSLDGFMEGPNRELDWHLVDDELHGHFNEELGSMGAFLDGRVTYELMAEFSRTGGTCPRLCSRRPLRRRGGSGGILPAARPDRRVPDLRPSGRRRRRQAHVPLSDARINLRFVEAHTFGNGVVLLRYQRP